MSRRSCHSEQRRRHQRGPCKRAGGWTEDFKSRLSDATAPIFGKSEKQAGETPPDLRKVPSFTICFLSDFPVSQQKQAVSGVVWELNQGAV